MERSNKEGPLRGQEDKRKEGKQRKGQNRQDKEPGRGKEESRKGF